MYMSHKRRFYAGMVGGVAVLSWLIMTSCSGKMANTDVSREADNSCYLCGNGGLMGHYGEFDSIGFMNVNTGQILDIPILSDADGGKSEKEVSGSSYHLITVGDGGSAVAVSTDQRRRFGKGSVMPGENSNLEEEKAGKLFCKNCLSQLLDTYNDRLAEEIPDTTIVDFVERKFYAIDKRYSDYLIRDYYLHFDFLKDRTELLVFYAPKRR